jgi:hypothetical protein
MLIDLSEEKRMCLQDSGFLDQGLLPLHPNPQQGCFEEGSGLSSCIYLWSSVPFE